MLRSWLAAWPACFLLLFGCGSSRNMELPKTPEDRAEQYVKHMRGLTVEEKLSALEGKWHGAVYSWIVFAGDWKGRTFVDSIRVIEIRRDKTWTLDIADTVVTGELTMMEKTHLNDFRLILARFPLVPGLLDNSEFEGRYTDTGITLSRIQSLFGLASIGYTWEIVKN